MNVLVLGRAPRARRLGAALWGASMLGVSAVAAAADARPTPQKEGEASYIVGGVGRGEARAIEQLSERYPLQLTFLAKIRDHGAYTLGAQVSIKTDAGDPVLELRADGPLMLVDLPAGRYIVSASLDGQTLEREVEVGGTPQELHFEWPGRDEPQRELWPNDMTVKLSMNR